MELLRYDPDTRRTRPAQDVLAMAIAVQANLVCLKVADAKRRGLASDEHEIKVPAPGPVTRYRETLIDPKVTAGYLNLELHLRLHEVWGQFCLMQWLFSVHDSHGDVNLAHLPADAQMQCDGALEVKHTALHAFLWRIRFEDRRRNDPDYLSTSRFKSDAEFAATIPANAFSKPIDDCSDEEVLLAGCQYAGLLGAIRWVMDGRRAWAEPGIMDVDNRPF